ncbi:hypothetical protein BHE74_00036452 [Ensete ventricosum]|nr:hypothetical protein BHE74_00036452 [Ensete ventricosum]
MEVPIKFYRGINSYWRRRKYQKLESSSSPGHKKSKKVTRLGAVRGTRRWFVRLRRSFRFRIRLPSPARLLVRLRDAYVDCMLAMAGKAPGLSTKNGPEVWSKRIPTSRSAKIKSVEFERRLICEIYKSLVISGEL